MSQNKLKKKKEEKRAAKIVCSPEITFQVQYLHLRVFF